MKRILIVLLLAGLSCAAVAQTNQESNRPPTLPYKPVLNFFILPDGKNFGEVSGVAVNSKGHIFVFHRGQMPLMEFDNRGRFVRGLLDGIITHAHGLRVDSNDNLWLTDDSDHFVLKVSPEGRILMVFGRKGRAGESDPRLGILFNRPTDVAVNSRGEIFVTDGYGNSRVVKFDRTGRFLKTWGKKGKAPGEFDTPHAVVIDAQDHVYVADRENGRIQVFDSEGNFLREWGGLKNPQGLFITANQFLYVADGYANRILKMDLNGKILGIFGEEGKWAGQFGIPHALAVGEREEIYAAELLNWRVQKFEIK